MISQHKYTWRWKPCGARNETVTIISPGEGQWRNTRVMLSKQIVTAKIPRKENGKKRFGGTGMDVRQPVEGAW